MWLPRFSMRRFFLFRRFSVTALLVLVAVIAIGLNRVRPMSQSEAARLAKEHTAKHEPEIEVDKIPVATYWVASHRFWVVVFQRYKFDSKGYPLMTGLPFEDTLLVNHDGRVRPARGIISFGNLREDDQGNYVVGWDPTPDGDFFRGVSP
jgi:hypothetical protein